jgi:hypothetical protein
MPVNQDPMTPEPRTNNFVPNNGEEPDTPYLVLPKLLPEIDPSTYKLYDLLLHG